MIRKKFCLLLVASLCAACGGTDPEPTEIPLTQVTFNELGMVAAGTYLFRTRAEWEAFWVAHPHPGYPIRQVPVVDFGNAAVAGIFAGPKGRCNRLDITSGSTFKGTVTLRYRISTFGAGTPSSCIGNDQFTLNLADVVLVPKETSAVKSEAE
jgi:hypothetical protein